MRSGKASGLSRWFSSGRQAGSWRGCQFSSTQAGIHVQSGGEERGRSGDHAGAVNGAGSPISIPGVMTVESNIHAGVKFLHQMAEQCFSDPRVDAENRLLFSFAAYNAGSNRVADLTEQSG